MRLELNCAEQICCLDLASIDNVEACQQEEARKAGDCQLVNDRDQWSLVILLSKVKYWHRASDKYVV